MTIQTLAKKISPKATTTQAQPPAKVELGRATVTAIPGDGTLTVNLNGSTVDMPVDDCTGGTAQVGGEVEVLIAPPRHVALPVIGETPAEVYAIGGAGVMVGTLPTTGIRTISVTFVGTCTTGGGISVVTIPLTSLSPHLTVGYNAVVSSGDSSTLVSQVVPVPSASSLTALEVLISTASGGTIANGTTVRVNVLITGA